MSLLYGNKHGKDGVDISKLMSNDHMDIWSKRNVAKFLNASYEYVVNMPYDEFLMCQYLSEIDSLSNTSDGFEVLKNNIRYTQTEPDVDKLRKKYGKGGS